jgi:hypothetical protein
MPMPQGMEALTEVRHVVVNAKAKYSVHPSHFSTDSRGKRHLGTIYFTVKIDLNEALRCKDQWSFVADVQINHLPVHNELTCTIVIYLQRTITS